MITYINAGDNEETLSALGSTVVSNTVCDNGSISI